MQCRSCGKETEHVLSLGEMPLANRLLSYPSESYKKYPLDLMFCPSCKLGQLKEQVDPELMFQDYVYYSSINSPTVAAAKELTRHPSIADSLRAEALKDMWGRKPNIFIAEIGSNDGYLLQHYANCGIAVLGIDPARGPANVAALKTVPTAQEYFTLKLAKTLPKADVIHAHNVLAHVQDLNDVVAGIAVMLKENGVCVVEVPYLGDMIKKGTYDLVYHEHNYYFSIHAVLNLFLRHGMSVSKIERIPSHGGSLRLFFIKRLWYEGAAVSAEEFDWVRFHDNISQKMAGLKNFLYSVKQPVWGFGAAAKATVMLNLCKVGEELVAIADDTPAKWGRFVPGTGQKIVPVERWLEAQPEWTCVFAWNYEKEIKEKYKDSYKGTFFTPYHLPVVQEP